MASGILGTIVRLSAATLAAMTIVSAAQADNFRYVSINGNNANPCTLAQPCRTLARGVSQTPAGGELHILGSGFYGNGPTIKRSITIVGNGHTITLNSRLTVDKDNAVVAIRRLAINGEGALIRGVNILAAASVHIEQCLFYRHTGQGIYLDSANTRLVVADTVSRDNQDGLYAFGAGAKVTVTNSRFDNNSAYGVVAWGVETTISRSSATHNTVGFAAFLTGRTSVTSSLAAHNASAGFFVDTDGQMTLDSVVSRGNDDGLLVSGTARTNNSTFTNNTTGINNGGTTETWGNNTVGGNTTPTSGNALSLKLPI